MKKKSSVDLESCITAAVLVIMLTLVFLGVVSRYALHFSFSFTEELVCALFVLLGTVGSALACKRRSLYTLDLLTGAMKPKMQTIFSIITTTLTLLAALFLFWTSFSMISTQFKLKSLTVALRVPAWTYTTAVPFGIGLVIIRCIQNILQDVRKLKKLKEEGEAQ